MAFPTTAATWGEIQEGVRLAISAALSLPDRAGIDGTSVHAVEWANKREAQRYLTPDQAWCDLSLTSVMTLGVDETRYERVPGVNAASTVLRPTVCGLRTFNVLVNISNYSQAADEETVGALGAKLRTRLRRNDVRALHQAANVALVNVAATRIFDYREENGRMVSSALCETHWSTVEQDTDSTGTGDFVAQAQGDGLLTNVDGSQLALAFDGP